MSVVPLLLAVAMTPGTLMAARQISPTAFIAIGVWYPVSADVDAMRRDFQLIQSSGFNAILTSVSWKDGEPRRGAYNLLDLDRLIAVASETGLRVHVDVLTELEPAWKRDGTDALPGTFYEYVRRRVGTHPSVAAVNAAPNSPGETRRAVVGPAAGHLTLQKARLAMWAAVAAGSRAFGFAGAEDPVGAEVLALGEVAGVITRNSALFGPLRPRALKPGEVTVQGGSVSVTILESSDAIAIIALNDSAEVRKVTITFPPETPEAIWQSMEAGNAVHFVMGATGPFLEHTFGPEDVLVLAIRKALR